VEKVDSSESALERRGALAPRHPAPHGIRPRAQLGVSARCPYDNEAVQGKAHVHLLGAITVH